MESFVHEYISSTFDDDILSEGLLERRLSPYATLRAGDLAALLRLQTPLPALVNATFNRSHGNDGLISSFNKSQSSQEIDDVAERKGGAFEDVREEEDDDFQRQVVDVVCRGTDTNDSPAQYTVKGLRHHEMAVMGICVDERICPGFRYSVRKIGNDRLLYETPKTLLSVGMGYGKRITFTGHSLNNNECYFWSDSEPTGYAFSLHAIDVGQKFSILDSDHVIVGEAIVDVINEPQTEISSMVKDKKIIKHVNVTMTCSLKYYQRHNHGLVEMMVHEDSELLNGIAVLTKSKSNKTAVLTAIEEVFIERFGLCKFELDV